MIKVLLFLLIIIFSFKGMSLEVTLTQGSIKPTPIAVTNLFSDNLNLEKTLQNLNQSSHQ